MKVLKAALLGRSLPYSISPDVHHQLFRLTHAKWGRFDTLDYSRTELLDENSFREFVQNNTDYNGFNITFPYKFIASTLEGQTSETVRSIHSANTIGCDNPRSIISTDGNGFRFALEKLLPAFRASGFSLVMLGAGGAARAVLYALMHWGWRKTTIAARSLDAARNAHELTNTIIATTLDDFRRDAGPHFVVQATPVGQRGGETLLQDFEWRPGDIAADLIYNPLRTRFLERARNGGAATIDGLGMLIEQAALSQYFWTTGTESNDSVLTNEEFHTLHASLSKLLKPRWDASDI